jgi:hypothetical protein
MLENYLVVVPLQSRFFSLIFFLYFEKGKFGGKKFTFQKSESTLQRSFCQIIFTEIPITLPELKMICQNYGKIIPKTS